MSIVKKVKEMSVDIQKASSLGAHLCDAIAMGLYDEGYRKQSDTAREIFAEIGKILTAKYNAIQAGYHHRMRYGNVDTPQGMKELGELSGVRQVIAEIKAFEKKYTEADSAKAD